MRSLAKLAALTVLALSAGTAARAALLDLTDMSTFDTMTAAEAAGEVAGVNFSLTGSVDRLTYNTGGDAPGPVGGILAGLGDGIGIGGDEVAGANHLSIFFDKKVRLTAVHLLDFYATDGDAERVVVYSGTPPSGGNVLADAAATAGIGGKGFGTVTLSDEGQTFSFDAGAGNDGRGVGDFALAGLEFELVAIPLPASAAAMLSVIALAGGFAYRRRR